MKEIFSKRLKSARNMAALSQGKLVEKMGNIVSKNAISKYERGQMMANSNVLLALSEALNVKLDYFFRPFTVEIKKIEFRKKKRLATKDSKVIMQIATDFVERYIEIEQFLNITSSFVSPIQDMAISTIQDVEEAALQVRSKWKLGINTLPNVIDLLEDKEIKVIEVEAPDSFDGFSGWGDGRIPIIVINKNYNAERKRLTALHELGHLILNINEAIESKEKEKICFQFAGAMLMPEPTFRQEIGDNRSHFFLSELISVKETYGISIQAIMARAKNLGIITESHYTSFCKKISNNRSEKNLGTYKGAEQSFRFKQLIYRAAAEEIISLSKAANLSNQKLAEFRKEFVTL
ncbi:MAG: XRE family transcriptional regulator [Bacteroidales bacterium]